MIGIGTSVISSLLGRVRESYRRQADQPDWVIIDGEQTKDAIAEQVLAAVSERLSTPTTDQGPGTRD